MFIPHYIPTPGSEPNGNEPQKPSFGEAVAGCVCGLLLIIGGIRYWNYWRGELDRKAREEVQRQMRHIESVPPPMTKEAWENWQEQNKRFNEQLQMLQDVANKAQMRR